MMKHVLGIFLLIVISTAPCWAQADGVQRVEAAYGSRVYTLSLPQGWQQLELRQEKEFSPVLLRLAGPDGINKGAVYLQRFPRQQMSLEDYKSAARSYIQETMKGQLLSQADVTIAGQKAWRSQYEGNGPGFVDAKRRFQNTVLFDGDSIIVVHCAAPPELWEKLKPSFDSISQSLSASERRNE